MRVTLLCSTIMLVSASAVLAAPKTKLILATSVQAPYALRSISVDEPGVIGVSGGSVSLGDVDGDGRPDAVVGYMGGGLPVVKVFDTDSLALRSSFTLTVPVGLPGAGQAFGRYSEAGVLGGGSIGLTSVGGADEPAYIQSLRLGPTGVVTPVSEPYAPYGSDYALGMRVAVGDVDGDGVNEVAASTNKCSVGHVTLLKREAGAPPRRAVSIDPYAGPGPDVDIEIDIADINGDNRGEIATIGPNALGGKTLKLFQYTETASDAQLNEVLSFSWAASTPNSLGRSGGGGGGGHSGHVTLLKRTIAPPLVIVSSNDGDQPVVSSFEILIDPATGGFTLGPENALDLASIRSGFADLDADWSNVSFALSAIETAAPPSLGGVPGLLLGLSPTRVPEPATLALFAGASLLTLHRRRRSA